MEDEDKFESYELVNFDSWDEFREEIENQEQIVNKINNYYEERHESYYEGDFY